MKIVRKLKVGFTHVYTSDSNDLYEVGIELPHKKPFLIFALPREVDHSQYLDTTALSLRKLGVRSADEQQIYITITNPENIIKAINIFAEMPEYSLYNNASLFANLVTFKENCESEAKAKQEIKRKTPLPSKSKKISDFKLHTDVEITKTSNDVTYATRKSKKTNLEKGYFFKRSPAGRSITEFEAFNGFCYRLLLGKRHPKVRVVYNEDGTRAGLISRSFDQLVPFKDLIKKGKSKENFYEKVLESEAVKVYAAAYVEEDTDLNQGNYGIDATGFAVKIDDDRGTWPLTSKYASIHPDYSLSTFNVTQRDIENFPVLMDAKPQAWPIKPELQAKSLTDNPKIKHDKYYIFLKRILIPREVYEAIGLATIQSEKQRKKFVDHKCKKTEDLKSVLFNTPEFRDYVMYNPQWKEQIISEFAEYNQDYKKSEDAHLKVDLSQIETNFDNIHREIYKKHGVIFPEIQNIMDKMFMIFDYQQVAKIPLPPGLKFEDLLRPDKLKALKTSLFDDELSKVQSKLAYNYENEIDKFAVDASSLNEFLIEAKKITSKYLELSKNARTHMSVIIHPKGTFDTQLEDMDAYLDKEIAKQLIYEKIDGKNDLADRLKSGLEDINHKDHPIYNSIELKVESILKSTHRKQRKAINLTLDSLHQKILYAMHTMAPLEANIKMPSQFFRKDRNHIARGKLIFTKSKNDLSKLEAIELKNIPNKSEFNEFKGLVKQYNAAVHIKQVTLMEQRLNLDESLDIVSANYANHIVESAKLTREYEKGLNGREQVSLKEDPTWKNVAKIAVSVLTGGLGYVAMAVYHGTFNIFKPAPLKLYDPLKKLTHDNIHKNLHPKNRHK